jgi:hypothetical protein
MDKAVSAFAIVCAFLAFAILWLRVKKLEIRLNQVIATLVDDAEKQYEKQITQMFQVLTEDLDDDD